MLSKDASDAELERVERLIDSNQIPYGSTDSNDERAQQLAREEVIIQAAASISAASSSETKKKKESTALPHFSILLIQGLCQISSLDYLMG